MWRSISGMLRVLLPLAIAAAVAVPAAASAAGAGSIDHTFTLPTGMSRHTDTVVVTGLGTLRVSLKYSDITNPHAKFRVVLRKSTWTQGKILIVTTRAAQCQGAAGSIICSTARAHTDAGTYSINTVKLTNKAATVELRASFP
jgi:hypothetical protein